MKMSRRFIVLSALLICGAASAAPARDGFRPDLTDSAAVPRYAADAAAMAKAVSAARVPDKHAPLQFAVGAEMPLDLSNGQWSVLDDGTAIWKMRLASSGAKLLSANFSSFHVPADAKLYFYDSSGAVVQGPFTAANQTASGLLSLPVVPGDEATLELRVPNIERDQVQLKLAHVYHAFRSLSAAAAEVTPEVSGITGDSAANCETNVICSAGDNWRNPIRSTGLLQIGDGRALSLCSGDLVNNVRQDDTAYFLTAHHCGVGNSGDSAEGIVVYWNYEADTCSGTSGDLTQNQTGSTLEATDAGSDFTLIKLDSLPPSTYNVFYAGWDVSSSIASSGVSIHHPEADIKKISTYSTPVSRTTITLTDSSGNAEATVQTWKVSWSSGITEEGSSGSGLWNQSSRIVGVLSGGDTECASGTSSTGNDYYGRLEVAWTANTAASGQLKAWLDPDSTGTLVLDGKNPGTAGTTTGSTTGGTTSGGSSSGSKSSGGSAIPPGVFLPLLALAALRRKRNAR